MLTRQTRIGCALAAVLAGALALPGVAAAHGERDWQDERRGDWYGERERRDWYGERERRDWAEYRYPRREHRHWRHDRPDVVVVERPVYVRPYVPAPPRPTLWGNNGPRFIRK